MLHSGCTLSVTVASTDLPFLGVTLPHLARQRAAQRAAWTHRMVLADVAPVTGQFVRRPPGDAAGLLRLLERLRGEGRIDQVVPLEASSSLLRDAWRGALPGPLAHPRDYRGAPIASYLLSLALCPTRYLVHFDGDMLLYQPEDAPSWVDEGIALLERCPDVGAVLPLSGPPHPDGRLLTRRRHVRDPRGFWRFGAFTSRVFLVDCERVRALHPLDPRWPWTTSPGRRLSNLRRRLRGASTLPCWEDMMGRAFAKHGLCRADLAGPAWSLHPNARGETFVRLLPRIVGEIESGRFPPAQAGRYNLDLEAWREWLEDRAASPGSGVPVEGEAGDRAAAASA